MTAFALYPFTAQEQRGMSWFEYAFTRYGWIWIGLTFGFAAKYALLIKHGVKIKPVLVLADIFAMPMVALVSYSLITKTGVSGEGAALVTALATLGADRIVKLYTDRFVRGITDIMTDESTRRKQALREEIQMELSAGRDLTDIATGKRPMGGE